MSKHDSKLLELNYFKDLIISFSLIKKCIEEDFGYNTVVNLDSMKDTPYRAAKAFTEILMPKVQMLEQVEEALSVTFSSLGQAMITTGSFPVISMCPHHFLPIYMDVTIGYIPEDKVLGLSKIVRVGQLLGKQPILQEDYTKTVIDQFNLVLKPIGVGVFTKGKHGCILCRGVKENTSTIITEVSGNFKDEVAVKNEFLSYVNLSLS